MTAGEVVRDLIRVLLLKQSQLDTSLLHIIILPPRMRYSRATWRSSPLCGGSPACEGVGAERYPTNAASQLPAMFACGAPTWRERNALNRESNQWQSRCWLLMLLLLSLHVLLQLHPRQRSSARTSNHDI